MFMTWNDELLTGLKDVDEQHKWLVDAANRLHSEVIKPQSDPKVVGEILEGLVDYTYNHFIMEEELFQRLEYPDAEAHCSQHSVFTTNINELLTKHERGELVTQAALELVKDWLIQHIMKTDMAYVRFFKSKGVA